MIGRRGFRIVEPPRASCRPSRSAPAIEHRRVVAERQLPAALALPHDARAPPGLAIRCRDQPAPGTAIRLRK